MNVDWSKAPEWAIGHALYAFGGAIAEVWVGELKYQRLDQSKSFPYGGGSGESRHNPCRYQFSYEQLRPSPDERAKELLEFTSNAYRDLGLDPCDAERMFCLGYRKQVKT